MKPDITPHIAFFGTPDHATTILEALTSNTLTPKVIITKPDAPVGRKKILTPSPVRVFAESKNIPILTPLRLDNSFLSSLDTYALDIAIVVAYGKIFSKGVLDYFPKGCVNIHFSPLPLYRGASPVQNTLLDGRQETGVTFMLMDEGMDTGPILAKETLPIKENDTTETLMKSLAHLGASSLPKILNDWLSGNLTPRTQNHTLASHCRKLSRQDGRVDWARPAKEIYNQYRAFTPWPGLFTFRAGKTSPIRIKLGHVHLLNKTSDQPPGTVIAGSQNKLGVVCGDQTLLGIENWHEEGKQPLEASMYLRGHPHLLNDRLI